MAYETIATITRYTWLSTDTKPTGCNDGSTGFERDTGKNYVYSTISGWGLAAMPVVPFNSSGTEISPATAALQTTGNTSLSTIAGKDFATQATLSEVLSQLQSAVTPVAVNGSILEYQWLSTDTPPVLGTTDRAFGIAINTATHVMTTHYWTGSAWQEVA